jgi:hypothetical protein
MNGCCWLLISMDQHGEIGSIFKFFKIQGIPAGAGAAHEEHEEHEQVIGTHKVRFWTGFHTIF